MAVMTSTNTGNMTESWRHLRRRVNRDSHRWAVAEEDTRQWPTLRAYAIQNSVTLTADAPGVSIYGKTVTATGNSPRPRPARRSPASPSCLQWQAAGSTTWKNVGHRQHLPQQHRHTAPHTTVERTGSGWCPTRPWEWPAEPAPLLRPG